MSSMVESRTQTIQERSAAATRRLTSALHVDDLKLLAAALAEVAADEVQRNDEFALRIRTLYRELESVKSKARSTSGRRKKELPTLVPITRIEERIETNGPLDPYFLLRLYGADQLRLALDGYSLAKLKEGMAAVAARNPGTRPGSKASKAPLIDYIVAHVAGLGY